MAEAPPTDEDPGQVQDQLRRVRLRPAGTRDPRAGQRERHHLRGGGLPPPPTVAERFKKEKKKAVMCCKVVVLSEGILYFLGDGAEELI